MTPHAVAESQVFSFCLNTRGPLLRFLLKTKQSSNLAHRFHSPKKDYDVLIPSRKSWAVCATSQRFPSPEGPWDQAQSPLDPSEQVPESQMEERAARGGSIGQDALSSRRALFLRGGHRPGPSRMACLHPLLSVESPARGLCPVRSVPAWPFPTRLCPSGSGGLGRKHSDGIVTIALVLTIPSPLSLSDLLSPRIGTSKDRPPSSFPQGKCQGHHQPSLSRGQPEWPYPSTSCPRLH